MYILGINVYHADASAVLIRDGQLIAALEEERFRRVKHFAGFPAIAIRRCLEIGGIEGKDIDAIAVSRNPRANLLRKAAFVLGHRPGRALLRDRLNNHRKLRDFRIPLADALSVRVEKLPKIHYVEHHPAHLASAFFVSPFEEAAVCALDGFGDFVSTSLALGKDHRLKILDKICFPHSLGMLYTAVTQHLGFLSYGDEFKVMGLAPYGKPKFVDAIRRLERLLGPARRPEQPLSERHEDIARSLQVVYETCAFHVLNALWERTKSPRLCLAGGCAMNSVANGKVRTHTPFKEIYVQPAASDNGTALGAAYFVWHQSLGNPRTFVMDHALWGTSYEACDFESLLSSNGDKNGNFQVLHFSDTEETCRATARLLADGNVVGWFQGRMEWGARALGNRSILADPRRVDMRDLINAKIKFREKFRPFAPSILEEAVHDYFVDPACDPFMQQVYPVRDDKRHLLPAITHVDGTGRVQTVNRTQNPLYYRLIQEFKKLTGVPLLLNTSFNENEPIVDTPKQALDCFLRTKMDGLAIGSFLVLNAAGAKERDIA